MSTLACLMCQIDPQTSSFLLPMAQAAVISAPILLRDQIRRGWRGLRRRRAYRARLEARALAGRGVRVAQRGPGETDTRV
jgi:hypothetical protein